MIGINLIPEHQIAERRKRRRIRAWTFTLLTTAAISAAPVGLELSRQHQVIRLRNERSSVLASIQESSEKLNRLREETHSLHAELDRADALRAKRRWSGLLAMISRALADEIWLISVATDPPTPQRGDRSLVPKNTPAPAKDNVQTTVIMLEAPRKLTLEGFALEHRDLYEFKTRLSQTGIFTDVNEIQGTKEPVGDGSAVRFKIVCHW